MEKDNKLSKQQLKDKLRSKYLEAITNYLMGSGEEVLRTASNEICLPCVDECNNDEFMVITFKVPSGSRDGEPYDGYAVAEDYSAHIAEKAEKAKLAAESKQKKIARDAAEREAKARMRAEHKKASS